MISVDGTQISCGVVQISDLHADPEDMLLDLGKHFFVWGGEKAAFVTWSDVWGRNKHGNKLYHYIRRQFPRGNVVRTNKGRNPNSGNQICVYVWKIPRGFKKWFNSYELDLPENERPWWCY